jgi:hypothetical protein
VYFLSLAVESETVIESIFNSMVEFCENKKDEHKRKNSILRMVQFRTLTAKWLVYFGKVIEPSNYNPEYQNYQNDPILQTSYCRVFYLNLE